MPLNHIKIFIKSATIRSNCMLTFHDNDDEIKSSQRQIQKLEFRCHIILAEANI